MVGSLPISRSTSPLASVERHRFPGGPSIGCPGERLRGKRIRLTRSSLGKKEANGMSSFKHRRVAARSVVTLACAVLAALHPGIASAQHLGEVICSVDSAFAGTILAMKDKSANAATTDSQRLYELTARVDQVIKATAANATLRLELSTRLPAQHLREGSTYVFLLSRGKLIRLEPSEHAGIVKKLLGDPSHCKRS
jgi:hypothetical protein